MLKEGKGGKSTSTTNSIQAASGAEEEQLEPGRGANQGRGKRPERPEKAQRTPRIDVSVNGRERVLVEQKPSAAGLMSSTFLSEAGLDVHLGARRRPHVSPFCRLGVGVDQMARDPGEGGWRSWARFDEIVRLPQAIR